MNRTTSLSDCHLGLRKNDISGYKPKPIGKSGCESSAIGT